MSSPSIDDVIDVCIIGGGVSGLSTANVIASKIGLSCILFDFSYSPSFKIGESLPPTAKPILKQLNIYELFKNQVREGIHRKCKGNKSIWGSTNLSNIEFFSRTPYGSGYHLNRLEFEKLLKEQVVKNGTTVKDNCKVIDLTFNDSEVTDSHWIIKYQNKENKEEIIKAKWIVDASGRKRIVPRKLKVKIDKYDKLLAFYALFTCPEIDNVTETIIESVEFGWWYSAILPDGKRIIVFHTDDDLPIAKKVRRKPGFMEYLKDTSYLWPSIVNNTSYTMDGNVKCIASDSSILSSFFSPFENWICVGDSAMTFDPLSSQGMLTGMITSVRCAQVLSLCFDPNGNYEIKEIAQTYDDYFTTIFVRYLEGLDHFYHSETRWKESKFWKRRQTTMTIPQLFSKIEQK